jgi:biopolymer transport protein ExbD
MNVAHPRLSVKVGPSDYADFVPLLFWPSLISIGVGLSLLIIAGIGRFRTSPAPVAPAEGAGPVGVHVRWKRRVARVLPITDMILFRQATIFTWLVLLIFVLYIQTKDHWTSTGLPVRLQRAGTIEQANVGIQPVLVQVKPGDKDHIFYVDSRPVPYKDLPAVLEKEIMRRPPRWPVYLEGDPNMEFATAAQAIDAIRGVHAEVVLLGRRNPPSTAPAAPPMRR